MNKEKRDYSNEDSGKSARSDAETTELYTQSYDANKSGNPRMGNTGEQISDKAGQVADQAKNALGDTVDKVREQAVSQADQQKSRAADTLNTVAGAVRQTGDQLRQQDQGLIAQYVDTAANQIERLATYLNKRDINDMAIEVQHFARRQPALFLGGALLAGMVAARFLKSSSRQVNGSQSRMDYGYGANRGYGSYGSYSGYGSYGGYGANKSYSSPDYAGYNDYDAAGNIRPARVEASGYARGTEGSYERDYGDSAHGDTGMTTEANSGSSTEVP